MKIFISICLRYGITANILTSFGLLFVIFGIFSFAIDYKIVGFAAIVLGLAIDAFDGALARATKTVSKFGKIFDRLSDKVKFNALVMSAIFIGGYQTNESLILWGFPVAIAFLAFVNCAIEFWGVLLIAYQWIFEPLSKGSGAVKVGKIKFFAQSVFGAALFYPDTYFIVKPIVLFIFGSIGAVLAIFSFAYHIRYVKKPLFFVATLPFVALFSYASYIFFIK